MPEHLQGCLLKQLPLRGQVKVKVIKECLQAHTFSWLHNDTLQHNYDSTMYNISRGLENVIIYNSIKYKQCVEKRYVTLDYTYETFFANSHKINYSCPFVPKSEKLCGNCYTRLNIFALFNANARADLMGAYNQSA